MRDTIDMAREANLAKYGDGLREGVAAFINALERFEALARADEREACAKEADKISDKYGWGYSGNEVDTADEIAAAIRARGNT